MQEFILKNLITIIFILLLIYGFIKGFAAGFLKKVLSFGSLIITVILTKYLTPVAATILKDTTNVEATLTARIYDLLIKSNLYDKFNIDIFKTTIDTTSLGETLRDGLCTNIANALINLVCGIAVFIISLIVIKLILKILDIVDMIPVVSEFNKFLGGVLGILEMVVVTWAIFTVFRVLESVPQVKVIVDNINQSPVISVLYNNNLVYNFLANLFSIFKGSYK